MHGTDSYNRPSRFITEIPEELIQEVRQKNTMVRPASRPVSTPLTLKGAQVDGTEFKLGQRVRHGKFGEGVVVNYEGQGKQARIEVNFLDVGSKWLMMAYAKLEPVG